MTWYGLLAEADPEARQAALFRKAHLLHKQVYDFEHAEAAYREVLQSEADHVEAMTLDSSVTGSLRLGDVKPFPDSSAGAAGCGHRPDHHSCAGRCDYLGCSRSGSCSPCISP